MVLLPLLTHLHGNQRATVASGVTCVKIVTAVQSLTFVFINIYSQKNIKFLVMAATNFVATEMYIAGWILHTPLYGTKRKTHTFWLT